MAVVEELYKSRKRSGKDRERQYKIKGATDDADAFASLMGFVPGILDLLVLDKDNSNVEEMDAGVYLGTVKYANPDGNPSKQEVGSFSISFEIGSQSATLKQSYQTAHTFRTGSVSKDYQGAIGVDGQNGEYTVNGVEIQVPVFSFTVNYTVDPALITDAYVATLSTIVGRVNSDAFKNFAAGECLLTRVTGQRRDTDNWDLSFTFAVIRNDPAFSIAGLTVNKDGWDYLWCSYDTQPSTDGKFVLPVCNNVYVERVYRRTAYSALGLP